MRCVFNNPVSDCRSIIKVRIWSIIRCRQWEATCLIKVLFIIDAYNWAWDIASNELIQNSKVIEGRTVTSSDLDSVDLNDFDWILVYMFSDTGVRSACEGHMHKVILCVAGGQRVYRDHIDPFGFWIDDIKYIGANNSDIARIFKLRYPDKEVVVLLHGVDTKLFKPDMSKYNRDGPFQVGFAGNSTNNWKRFSKAEDITRAMNVNLKVADCWFPSYITITMRKCPGSITRLMCY